MATRVQKGFQPVNVSQRKPMDLGIFVLTLMLIVGGLWMVYDTTYVKSFDELKIASNSWKPILKQASIGGLGGMCALVFCWQFGYWRLRRFAIPFMVIGLVLLIAVFIPGIGKELNGAHRWIRLGIQPSEFAKFMLVIYLARIFSRKDKNVNDFWEFAAPPVAVLLTYVAFVAKEPDLGTAFVMLFTGMTMFALSNARKRHVVLVSVFLLAGMSLAIMIFPHARQRILSFRNPEAFPETYGFQAKHARWAVGSGLVTGQGLGQGREKYYLPQQDSDYIFATVAEETGFVGCTIVILLLSTLGIRGLHIASRTQDPFGRLAAVGFSSLILWQALINMAVATGSIPATGVPLPFISNGSSALIVMMAGVGVLLSVAQHPLPPTKRRRERA